MAVFSRSAFVGLAVVLSALVGAANAQLSPDFYSTSCPTLESIVQTEMASAVQTEKRMAASILRMFFHDCFVNGCDGSILLDGPGGEKSAPPNLSVRGYNVIDTIKAKVEAACTATVSCADILALAARDGVNLVGGPTWDVPLGRKDSRTASPGSTGDLPGPDFSLAELKLKFTAKFLSPQDMTALSGAHTIGRSQCRFFRNRIYNKNENIDRNFAKQLRQTCPPDDSLTNFDAQTADGDVFDNGYYKNLVIKKGLLHSDQELFNAGSEDALVTTYSNNQDRFFSDFKTAMVNLGNLLPLPQTPTEVRLNCTIPNPN